MKIFCQEEGRWTEQDRLELVRLLSRAGYMVRIRKVKREDNKPGNIQYVEFFESWEMPEPAVAGNDGKGDKPKE